ncbi:MAG: hypothetical protein RBT57_10695 [Paludibacter sp.]|jgi:hypothetical protein|nr:hypothetical protein [Paludibacter sp.]
MKNTKIITTLVVVIALLSLAATLTGILSGIGTDSSHYVFESIHGQHVTIFGKGVYRHMSADVAIQGIAQDYVTLFFGIPALLFSLIRARKGTLQSKLLLAGILTYFFLTYLFYMNMAMYNALFLVYIALTGTTFFALTLTMLSIETEMLPNYFTTSTPVKFIGGFLIFTASSIALLWMSIVVPPLLDRTIIPQSVEHYTTLTVQGFDLALFHPLTFIAGLLLIRKNKMGYLLAPVMLIFLSLLMTALIAKIIAMAIAGVNVIPAIFIIPVIAVIAITCAIILMRNIKTPNYNETHTAN